MSSKSDGLVNVWSVSPLEHVLSFAAHPELITYWTEPIGGLDWSTTGYIATGGAGSFDDDMINLWGQYSRPGKLKHSLLSYAQRDATIASRVSISNSYFVETLND